MNASIIAPIIAMIQRQMRKYLSSSLFLLDLLPTPTIFLLVSLLGIDKLIQLPFRINYSLFIVPGLLAVFIISKAGQTGTTFACDKSNFTKLLKTAPIKRSSIIIGFTLGDQLSQLISICFFMILFTLYSGAIPFTSTLLFFMYIILISLGFFSFAIFLSLLFKPKNSLFFVYSLLAGLLIITSGAFFPISGLSPFMKFFVYLNPLTYGIDALRYVLLGAHELSLLLGLLVLVAFFFISLSLGVFLLNKKVLS